MEKGVRIFVVHEKTKRHILKNLFCRSAVRFAKVNESLKNLRNKAFQQYRKRSVVDSTDLLRYCFLINLTGRLVKWHNSGLQNRGRGFDSLIARPTDEYKTERGPYVRLCMQWSEVHCNPF